MRIRFAERVRYRLRVFLFELSITQPVRFCAALFFTCVGALVSPFSATAATRFLCWAHYALTYVVEGENPIAARLRCQVEGTLRRDLSRAKSRITGNVSQAAVAKGIDWLGKGVLVLKAPALAPGGRIEKGVLVLKNSDRFGHFRKAVDVAKFLKRFVLVLEPSWSGYADPRILAFTAYDDPVFAMASCEMDVDFLLRLDSNILPLRMGASDWANPDLFRPLEGQLKRFDAVFVARWVLMKRHHLLLRAMRRLNDPGYRLAIVAATDWADPGVRSPILAQIESDGMAQQVTVFEDLTHDELNEVYNQSKVNVLLSRQEGANRALREGFFAGVPGMVLSDFIGLSKGHINARTGRVVDQDDLAEALASFRNSHADFDPRPWALENVAPPVSTARLNDALKQEAESRGKPWTRDIVCKCNSPELNYYPDSSAGDGLPGFSELLKEFRI